MTRLDRSRQRLAIMLAALAGFVDAIAFIASGGYFVSFMSGNSTRLGVVLAGGGIVGIILLLLAAFVCGVAVATVVGHRRHAGRRRRVMVLVTALLMLAALSVAIAPASVTLALVAAAMGAENGVFADGRDAIGLTYMTGTLVKIGQRIADAFTGGPAFGWVPFAFLWAGLIAGGVAGALTYGWLGLQALWLAVAIALLLTPLVGDADGTDPSPRVQPAL